MKTKKGIQKTALLSLMVFQTLAIHSFAQTQLGVDIDGEAVNSNSASSVSMPDAYTVTIGSPYGGYSGQARVFTLLYTK